jgi:hypothetical protein
MTLWRYGNMYIVYADRRLKLLNQAASAIRPCEVSQTQIREGGYSLERYGEEFTALDGYRCSAVDGVQ